MSGTVQKAAPAVATERYEALLRVLQTLISICSAEELFRLLAREPARGGEFQSLGGGHLRRACANEIVGSFGPFRSGYSIQFLRSLAYSALACW
jgi:hypothetical protein